MLDLQLLIAGGSEAGELMGELKASGLSVGCRAKVRLLIPAARLPPGRPATTGADNNAGSQDSHPLPSRRALQDVPTGSGGLSTDTIAIVLTVLVGAAGYFVHASMRIASGLRNLKCG